MKLKSKAILITSLILLLLLILSTKMKNISKYILYFLIAIGGVAIGIVGTKLFSKDKVKTEYIGTSVVYRDTCINRVPIINVETIDSFIQKQVVKKGKVQKVTEKPGIIEVSKKDSVYTTIFKKDFNWGLVDLKIKFDVEASSAARLSDFQIDYRLDTVVLNNLYVKTQTIIVKDTSDESNIIKYIPIEVEPKLRTWIGLGGSIRYEDKPILDVGLHVNRGRTSVGLYIDPQRGFKSISAYRVHAQYNLFNVSLK